MVIKCCSYIKYLKASNVQDANEVLSGLLGIQLLVDANNHPQEHLLKHSLCQCTYCIVYLKLKKKKACSYYAEQKRKSSGFVNKTGIVVTCCTV